LSTPRRALNNLDQHWRSSAAAETSLPNQHPASLNTGLYFGILAYLPTNCNTKADVKAAAPGSTTRARSFVLNSGMTPGFSLPFARKQGKEDFIQVYIPPIRLVRGSFSLFGEFFPKPGRREQLLRCNKFLINNLALKLPREPVSGLLGIKPFATNQQPRPEGRGMLFSRGG
jgi:hypothetical protein